MPSTTDDVETLSVFLLILHHKHPKKLKPIGPIRFPSCSSLDESGGLIPRCAYASISVSPEERRVHNLKSKLTFKNTQTHLLPAVFCVSWQPIYSCDIRGTARLEVKQKMKLVEPKYVDFLQIYVFITYVTCFCDHVCNRRTHIEN